MTFKSAVLVTIPSAGLGNRLLIWAHALAFAEQYNLPFYEKGWSKFSLGPYFRNERAKRNYRGCLDTGKKLPLRIQFKEKVYIPQSDWSHTKVEDETLYIFSDIPNYETYFDLIIPHRDLIIQKFIAKIQMDCSSLKEYCPPDLAIHIRLGDLTKTPWYKSRWDYYRKILQDFESRFHRQFVVHIFSDGFQTEIPLFDEFKNLTFISFGNDLIDMLAMSKASIIHPYPGSTFSLWAAFISDAFILHLNKCNLKTRISEVPTKECKTYNYDGVITTDFDCFFDNLPKRL